MTSTVSSKGQVTIPVEVRKLMHLRAGDSVSFVFMPDNRVEMIGVRNPASRLKGLVPMPERAVTISDMDEAIGTGGWK